jgi:site-specific recombinase XerC
MTYDDRARIAKFAEQILRIANGYPTEEIEAEALAVFAEEKARGTEFIAILAVPSIAAVQPLHIASWIEGEIAPTVKQRLAAIRHLFDWLVMGQIVPVNPAASVRGPAHSVRNGKTPVLDPAEARLLLDSIDVGTPIGLRGRALIALMVYSFGRVGAALAMTVEDVFTQNCRLWVRLREKGGKRHEMPCHHSLEAYLHAYLDGAATANHASTRTTQLYDRRRDEISLDEVERIRV